ncbi:histone-lysine N-methyltransferase SETD1A-like [Frankliniella occidentalis]|uniref:Histone-lysine N-methyltransferase SETD1A-like n=1 Tax=Frankliniella occidentalis TaxID=133901 RepID=A0A9C6UCH9_FRAOC|nr:histone-lysine N-methyltransferase SETD1A-like [Frankliniella occidentalis]
MGVVAKGKENTLKLKDLIARFDACNTHGRADRPLTKRASSTDSGIDVSPEPLVTQQDNVTLIQLVSSDSGASSSDEGGSASSASSGTRDSVLLLTHSGPSSWEDHPEPPRVDDKDSSPAVVERLVSFYQNAPDPATPTGTTPTPKMTLALGRQQLPNSAPWGMSRPRAPPPEPPPPASAPECAASIVKKVKEKFERLDQRPLEDTPSSTPLRRRGPSLDGFLGGARRRVIADPPAPAPPRRAVSDLSEIFFRAGVLEQLEAQRDERIAGHVVRLQARCRGFLARKQLAKRKVQ